MMLGRTQYCSGSLKTLTVNYATLSAFDKSRLPRITVPHRMLERIERLRARSAEQRRTPRHHGAVLVACKRTAFNHHRGQTYSDFNPQDLASAGWKHYKAKGDYFTINAVQGIPALQRGDDIPQTFEHFNLHADMVNGLHELGITQPTNIQALVIPRMMQQLNLLCAAETGSGKTLAYLLPILEKIRHYHKAFGDDSTLNRPYGIIVCPSRELADQIYAVVEDLCRFSPCSSHKFTGGRGTQNLLKYRPQQHMDLLVATPGVLSKLLTNRLFDLSRLFHVVLDEADTLLDDSFNALTLRLINKLKVSTDNVVIDDEATDEVRDGRGAGTQIAFVGATMPSSMEVILKDVVPFESIVKVTTPHLHRLMPHVPQKFLRVGSSQKTEELLRVLKRRRRGVPTIVFCNKASTADFVNHVLTDNGVSSVVLHARMQQKVRDGRFEQFQRGETDVLISTDIISRGLDTIRAQHVVNYDFPQFMSDYIHRVGRVGRVGSAGTGFVLSFVTQPWDVELLWKIESSARRATELHNVNANIKRKLTGIIEDKYSKKTYGLHV